MKTHIMEFDNNYLTHIYFNTKRTLKPEEMSAISGFTDSLPGIEEIVFLPDKIVITYYSYLITGDYIKETLLNTGFPMVEVERKKKSPVQRFFERIAESNKKTMNDPGPACCRPRF